MKSLTETQIRKLKPLQVSHELLAVFDDYPELKRSNYIDDETGLVKATQEDSARLLNIFCNNQYPIENSIKVARLLLRSSLKCLLLIEASDEIRDPLNLEVRALKSEIERELMGNFAYAEAVFNRAERRGIKLHVWSTGALHLMDMLEKGPMTEDQKQDGQPYELQISTEMKRNIYDTLERWFDKTIDGGKDGLNAAVDGLARLMFHYHPDGDDALVQQSIVLFIQSAGRGYLPSMIALADLVEAGEGVLTELERVAAVIAISKGAEKNPREGMAVLQRLQNKVESSPVAAQILEP